MVSHLLPEIFSYVLPKYKTGDPLHVAVAELSLSNGHGA